MADRARRVLSWLDSREDAPRWKGTRIHQLAKRVVDAEPLGPRTPSDPEYEDLLLARRELDELWLVSIVLGDGDFGSRFAEVFERMRSDPLHPKPDDDASAGAGCPMGVVRGGNRRAGRYLGKSPDRRGQASRLHLHNTLPEDSCRVQEAPIRRTTP